MTIVVQSGTLRGSDDAATTLWVDAVVNTYGGTVSTAQRARVNTLIVGLKADGDWNSFDGLWLFANENVAAQALTDIRNLHHASTSGSMTLAANGYVGDGASGYVNSGITPTGSDNFKLDSHHMLVYDVSDRATSASAGIGIMGTSNASATSLFQLSVDTHAYTSCICGSAASLLAYTLGNSATLVFGTRTGANVTELYVNERYSHVTGTDTTASVALPSGTMLIYGARYGGASVNYFPTDRVGIVGFGGGLTSAARLRIASRLNTYMTALGYNVYTPGTQFSRANKSAYMTLSGGNLVTTSTTGASSVGSSASATNGYAAGSGKWCFEVTLTTRVGATSTVCVGIISQIHLTDSFSFGSSGRPGCYGDGAGANTGGGLGNKSFTQGDTVRVAFDAVNSKVWWSVDGGSTWGPGGGTPDPATNTGGGDISGFIGVNPWFACVESQVAGDVWTANFSPSGKPSGFSNW